MQARSKPSVAEVASVYDLLALDTTRIGLLVAKDREYVNCRFDLYHQIVAWPDRLKSKWRAPHVDRIPWLNLYKKPPDHAMCLKAPFDPGLFDECAYCGGVEAPNQIDHFLEKAEFPEFALFPLNLVPVCGGCNPSRSAHHNGELHKVSPYLSDILDRAKLTCSFAIDSEHMPTISLNIDARRLSSKELVSCNQHIEYLGVRRRFIKFAVRDWRRLRRIVIGYTSHETIRVLNEQKVGVSNFHANYWPSVFYRALLQDQAAIDELRKS